MGKDERGSKNDPVAAWMDIRAVQSWFPPKRIVVGLLGSQTFHDPFSPTLCRCLGEALWQAGISITTPNTEGIAEMISWSYNYSGGQEAKQYVFHVVQSENKRPGDVVEKTPLGWIVAGGSSEQAHAGLFSVITPVYILIEGGPRCAQMARIAQQHGGIIIPVARSGGAASGAFGAPVFHKPNGVSLKDWLSLRQPWENIQDTAACIVRIAQSLFRTAV